MQKEWWVEVLALSMNRDTGIMFFAATCMQFHIRMALMKQYKLLILLNLDLWIHVFLLIFHVIKRKAYIKHFCYDRYCDCLKEKYFCDWVASWTICFSMEYHFYLKEWLIRHFTEKEQSEPVTSSICCQWFFKVLVYYQRKMSTVIWKCS